MDYFLYVQSLYEVKNYKVVKNCRNNQYLNEYWNSFDFFFQILGIIEKLDRFIAE